MSRVSRGLDRIEVSFDDPNLVANAGLLLVATLVVAARAGGVGQLDGAARRAGSAGRRPGRKVLTLVHAIVAGGSHIDHADVLRCGWRPQAVLPFRVMAPSTLGTFLRAFTFGHVRQLEAVSARRLRRAWALGAGPGGGRLVIDVDSTICEVAGKQKQGAALRLHARCWAITRSSRPGPTPARCCTPGCAKGSANTQRGREAVRRGARRPGAPRRRDRRDRRARSTRGSGRTTRSPPSAGWTCATRWRSAPTPKASTAAIAGDRRGRLGRHRLHRPTARPRSAESAYNGPAPRRAPHPAHRPPPSRAVARLASLRVPHRPRRSTPSTLDAFHRQHAVVELAIRDLKEGAGLEHVPSGNFHANAAWLCCAVLAHNLIRWTATLGDITPRRSTHRRPHRPHPLLALPGRLVNRSGTHTLRLPARWPWADTFLNALARLRASHCAPDQRHASITDRHHGAEHAELDPNPPRAITAPTAQRDRPSSRPHKRGPPHQATPAAHTNQESVDRG